MKQTRITYQANRQPVARHHGFRKLVSLVAVVVVLAGLGYGVSHALGSNANSHLTASSNQPNKSVAANQQPAKTAAAKPNPCANQTTSKLILVSVSKRHLWACDSSTEAYNSPVVTGMEKLAADLTPVGTYKIYAKETNLTLKGHDSTGSWSDPVSYWMPFLDNKYGAYGLHDATWRKPSQFGHISPDSRDASHGCVELPLATAKWIYNWAPVGTTVTIKS